MSEIIRVNINLDFMQRDTVLAILKEMYELKLKFKDIATSAEEKKLCRIQAGIAKELYDEIYSQKEKEYYA